MQIMAEWIIAWLATFAITTSLMPFFIVYFTQKKLGQMTREEGPKWHEVKSGTPTMGGVAFVIATVVTYIVMSVFKGYMDVSVFLLLFVLISFAIVGFLDDFLKLIRKQNEGLTSKQKFICQVVFSIVYVSVVYAFGGDMHVYIPFVGSVNSVFVYSAFSIVWLTGFSNAVNLTDGLDGLVAGLSTIALGAYTAIAYQQQQFSIALFCVTLMGGLAGFFVFNKKPARIFMGDVGSLALGAVFAVLSLLLKVEWSLLIIGIVFVIETASVILQVASYKTRKKRIFKMSPIHHHFEMSGWSEWKVVTVFWFVGLLGALVYFVM